MAKCICQDPFVACNRNLFEASPVPNLLDHVTEVGEGLLISGTHMMTEFYRTMLSLFSPRVDGLSLYSMEHGHRQLWIVILMAAYLEREGSFSVSSG